MMLKEDTFEFDVLDPVKVCTILSTHLPSKKSSTTDDQQDSSSSVLYSSLLKRLKLLISGYPDDFTTTQAELKLCEVFTAKVLCTTDTFRRKDRQMDFYAPVLDMFTRAQVTCAPPYYFRLVRDMKWELFAASLITKKSSAKGETSSSSLSTPAADFFNVALDQLDEKADLSVFMTVNQVKQLHILLAVNSEEVKEEEDVVDEYGAHQVDRILNLASMLVKQKAPAFAHQTERLLTYSLTLFVLRHLATSSDTIDELFRGRVSLFGLQAIPFSTAAEDQLKSSTSLISEVAFTRVKINLQDPALQRLSLRIILSAFLSPVATYDNLLNSLLIFSPLHYNRFILHLFSHHLRSLSLVASSVVDVLSASGEGERNQPLNLLTAMTILKFHANFDLLSVKSFADFVQALTSGKVAAGDSCGLSFEAMLANLLAYSTVQQSKEEAEEDSLSLQWLDMIYDLVNTCGSQSPSQSSPKHSFVVVSAFLLKLLSVVWHEPTKKELVGSIIRVYVQQRQKRKRTEKLKPGQVRSIEALLRRSPSVGRHRESIPDLLHHLEECFSPVSVG